MRPLVYGNYELGSRANDLFLPKWSLAQCASSYFLLTHGQPSWEASRGFLALAGFGFFGAAYSIGNGGSCPHSLTSSFMSHGFFVFLVDGTLVCTTYPNGLKSL